jgi:hypothetical protein
LERGGWTLLYDEAEQARRVNLFTIYNSRFTVFILNLKSAILNRALSRAGVGTTQPNKNKKRRPSMGQRFLSRAANRTLFRSA